MIELALALLLTFFGSAYIGYYFSRKSTQKKSLVVEFPPEISKDYKSKIITQQDIKVSENSLKIQCYDPATGFSLGTVQGVSGEEMKSIVSKARLAQKSYATTSFDQRRALLKTLLDWVTENQSEICALCCRDSGKTMIDGSFGEILTTCEKLRWTMAHGESVLAPEYRSPGMIMAHKIPTVEYHPAGVMGCIVSWNYPFHNVFGPVISALMAGNASVIKCSEHVAFSTSFWESVFHAALDLHGLDKNLIRIVNGWSDAGSALVESADKITFIGSPEVGKLVMRHASYTLTPVILELGGKDVAVVFDDADYDQIVQVSLRGTFQNAGQNCAGLERLIVQSGIYDKFVKDMTVAIQSLRVGPPLGKETVDMGAMTMPTQLDKIQELVDDAVHKGAKLLVGGSKWQHPEYPMGQYYLPTLLVNVTPDMRIAQEEVFGPVMTIMKFNTEQEAISLANSSPYGLGSSVFTLDYSKGERVCKQIRAGMCNINDFGANYLCQGLPFGGVGISGIDRFAGVEGLRGQCHVKATTTDKYRLLGIRTNLPNLLRFPLVDNSVPFQQSLIGVLYGNSWAHSIRSLMELVKCSIQGRQK